MNLAHGWVVEVFVMSVAKQLRNGGELCVWQFPVD